jgi:hypothetical protein
MDGWLGKRIRVRVNKAEIVSRAYEYGAGRGLRLGECCHADTGEWLATGRILPWKSIMDNIDISEPFEFHAIIRQSKTDENYYVFAEAKDFSNC